MKTVMLVFGTRPEEIRTMFTKLLDQQAPIANVLSRTRWKHVCPVKVPDGLYKV